MTLANNHVLDYDEEALLEMLDLLQQAETALAGAARNLAEARRPALLEALGLRIGIIAFTDNEPGWAAQSGVPGTNYLPIALDEQAFSPVRESIAQARAAGADLVVFTIHWGPNKVQRPSPLFRQFAHAVIDAGAGLFFGHSAHIFQGIELYNGRPIIYDAGDFVDDYVLAGKSVHSFPRSAWKCLPGRSAALCCDRTTRSVEDVIPTQSEPTSFSAMFRLGAKHAARFPCYRVRKIQNSA